MRTKNPNAMALGKLGGKASARSLTKKQRKERASKAGKALWKKLKGIDDAFRRYEQEPKKEITKS